MPKTTVSLARYGPRLRDAIAGRYRAREAVAYNEVVCIPMGFLNKQLNSKYFDDLGFKIVLLLVSILRSTLTTQIVLLVQYFFRIT